MKNTLLLVVLSIFIFIACSSNTENKSENKVEIDTIQTIEVAEQIKAEDTIVNKDMSQFYQLILAKDTTSKSLMVFIDPHGDGKFIADKIQPIAEKLNSNIICLNNVENNIPNYIDLINQDIDEFKKQNSVKPEKIYIIGFSGGARMAYQYANNANVAGIVMCGAGLGNMIENHTKYPIAFIAGDGDFNFNEQYYSPYSNIAKNKNILSLTFKGIHEWPNNDLLLFAINYIKNDKKVFNYSELMNDFNEFKKHNEQYGAFKQIEAINKIFATEQTEKDYNNFVSSTSFKTYIQKFEKSLQTELDRNNMLASTLLSEDWDWWNNKINKIDEVINTSKNQLEKASYQRTRAYLGILMYSVTGREMKNPDSKNIEKFFKIYEKLEPDNLDLKKFKEQYEYQKNM